MSPCLHKLEPNPHFLKRLLSSAVQDLTNSMSGDMCDSSCKCPYTCKDPSTSKKSPVPTFLSTVQSHVPNTDFIVANATRVTITLCFHSSVLSKIRNLSCFSKMKLFGYTNLGSQVQIQIIKSICSLI